ncbi:nitroreductase [Xenophilus arseniciresistens]|uniref:Nitroreductase n=1 Tax=Xenophilus arseniciresistens TaxID=1283306 RepID=A0AAE3T1M1_9BURK|nr:nitroreductase [Xenophilus arseniciresistens]MDA7417517.1 nitroreductase [Xenophilus arseniciresistens]
MNAPSSSVLDAVRSRLSVRAFLPEPVPPSLIRELLVQAARAPSGGNVQPWHIDVLAGEALAAFRQRMRERLAPGAEPEEPAYEIYPAALPEPWRSRRFRIGEALYARLRIPREDKAARLRWFANNFDFFGAPLALMCSVDRRMGPPQWSDLGMFLQTLMLLLRERGLDSCAQECWALYPRTVAGFLQWPGDRMIFCGMAIGRRDAAHPVNGLQSERAPLQEWARFHGC